MLLQPFWLLISALLAMEASEGDTISDDEGEEVEHVRIVVVGDWKTYQMVSEIGFATEYLSEQRFEEQVMRLEREGTTCIYCYRANTLHAQSMILVERLRNRGIAFMSIPDPSRLPMPAQLDSILRTIMPPLQVRDPHTAAKVTERIEEYRREWLRLYERKGNPRSRHVLKDGLI